MEVYVGETQDLSIEIQERAGNNFIILSANYKLKDGKGEILSEGICQIEGKRIDARVTSPDTRGTYLLFYEYVIGGYNKVARVLLEVL